VSVFKVLLLVKDAPRISDQTNNFLDTKGAIEYLDNYTVIRIFGSKEKPTLLPCHITDKMFVIKVARQYNYWLHIFQEKKKKRFIPLPWKVEDFMLRNVKKIEEFAACFSNLRLIYVETLTGFDPDKIFLQHSQTLDLGNFFSKNTPEKIETLATTLLLLMSTT